jgi:hypothetical protein
MAKLPGGGGSGWYDRARNADRSPGHVMVVRISSSALAARDLMEIQGTERQGMDRGSCRLNVPICGPRSRISYDLFAALGTEPGDAALIANCASPQLCGP